MPSKQNDDPWAGAPQSVDRRMPFVAVRDTSKGVAAQRKGEMTRKHQPNPWAGAPQSVDRRMPYVNSFDGGKGVSAQRKRVSTKHPKEARDAE